MRAAEGSVKCRWVSRQLGGLEVPDGCVEGKGNCLNGVGDVVGTKGVRANLTHLTGAPHDLCI